jgi:polyisoprenoid-binding protein YceI
MKKSLRYGIIAIVIVGLGLVVGPWTYINLIKDDAPAALTIDDNSDATIPSGSIEEEDITNPNGQWIVAPAGESVVGYRVKEILFGQSTEGVGRTREVEGSLTIANDQVTQVSFTVQMGTLTSDAANRDRQFNSRIMDTGTYPTSTFVLTQPIALPANAISGEVINLNAQGDLTLRGTTKPVQFPLQAKVEGATFTVVGNITIVFDDWGIPEPSLPGIDVDPDGLLEFSLVFNR